MSETLYAVVDIETTGGIPTKDRITEIAIALYDGECIIDRFQTLINPERSIPWEITRITGITDDMVADAPKFYEVAKKVVQMTENAIFVAHNVRFDYGFLKEEFSSLGYTFTRKQLCTVVLSRKAFPGLRSYALGNLIQHFGISVQNRHRAMDDVLATVDILSRILNNDEGKLKAASTINAGIKASALPKSIRNEQISALPETTGVYYFYNTFGHVIYVGKSVNIRKRILQHFRNTDQKTDKFIAKVADISFEETGSELISLLLESNEIKALQPEVNKAQRSKDYPYFNYYYTNDQGFICLEIDKSNNKNRNGKTILNHYVSKAAARRSLYQAGELFSLCHGLSGMNECNAGCFYYQTGSCTGACLGKEHPETYNERMKEAIEHLKKSFDEDFYILTEGRTPEETGIVLIQDGHYRGFGYLSTDERNLPTASWIDSIKLFPTNPECNQIVHSWLVKHPETRVVSF